MSTHIVNVAFDFDDDKVRKILEDSAEKKVIDELKEEVYRSLSKRSYGYGQYSKEEILKSLAERAVDSFFEDYKNEIIQEAAKILADKLVRSKAVKEATKQVLESAT